MVGFAGWSAAVPSLQKPPRAGFSDGPCRYVRLIIKKKKKTKEEVVYPSGIKNLPVVRVIK